jgi:hypothetical protein
MIQQTDWRKGAFKYYFKFIANFTNHTLGILKPKYCSLGLRAGHYWRWISVYFEGIAARPTSRASTASGRRYIRGLLVSVTSLVCLYVWNEIWQLTNHIKIKLINFRRCGCSTFHSLNICLKFNMRQSIPTLPTLCLTTEFSKRYCMTPISSLEVIKPN